MNTDNKTSGIDILRQIDLIDDKISELNKSKNILYEKIRFIKAKIVFENSNYIGKLASLTDDKGKYHRLPCLFISCNYDFTPKYHFNDKGNRIELNFENWL